MNRVVGWAVVIALVGASVTAGVLTLWKHGTPENACVRRADALGAHGGEWMAIYVPPGIRCTDHFEDGSKKVEYLWLWTPSRSIEDHID